VQKCAQKILPMSQVMFVYGMFKELEVPRIESSLWLDLFWALIFWSRLWVCPSLLLPGVNVINLFSSAIILCTSKLK